MDKNRENKLISFFFREEMPNEKRVHFMRWLLDSKNSDAKEEALQQMWDELDPRADSSTMEDLRRMHRKMGRGTARKLLPAAWTRVAAAMLLLVATSLLTFQLTRQLYDKEVEMVEFYSPNGESRNMILPDGTEVWLNSGSMIIYPERFSGNMRKIFLSGEANFAVTKDPEKRFVVNTHNLSVEALGTVFNVQDYPDLIRATATLEEGSVSVETRRGEITRTILKPNEQIVLNTKTGEQQFNKVDASRIAMWKEGYLVFQEASLDEILSALGKRYDVTVHFDSGSFTARSYTVRFFPEETLEETLAILQEITPGFAYTIKENSLYIH